MDTKEQTRALVRARLRELSRTDGLRESAQICARLAPWVREGVVAAFAPMPEEVQLWPLLEAVAASGRLVLPRVDGDALRMHRVPHLDGLRSGPLRLREPPPHATMVDPSFIDVILVPGLAFDAAGNRLGRGRGFYDRLLAVLPPTVPRIGVAYACQIVDRVPTERYDVPMTTVVTSTPEYR